MSIVIRKAEEKDYPQIVNLFKEFAAFEKLPEKMTNSVEKMLQEKEFFHCFVAVIPENLIVGYVTYFFCYYTWIGKSLYMDDLFVKPEYRGTGIGTRLINQVIAFGKSSQCRKLRWQVSGWNASAIDFYKNIGATIDHTEQDCDLLLN